METKLEKSSRNLISPSNKCRFRNVTGQKSQKLYRTVPIFSFSFSFTENYLPYYLKRLQDGSNIFDAQKKKGKSVKTHFLRQFAFGTLYKKERRKMRPKSIRFCFQPKFPFAVLARISCSFLERKSNDVITRKTNEEP